MSHQVSFDFYGITIAVHSQVPSVLKILETEFAFFNVDVAKARFQVELIPQKAPDGLLPIQTAKRISANSLTYDDGPVRWNDFHGKALSRYDYESGAGVIWCQDADLLHEIAYLMILSVTGKALDEAGFHKVHACGIRYRGRDVLIMLPSMGGKTTLFLELAQFPGVTLLSDDTPLISPEGKVLPFPLRVGVDKVPTYLDGDFPLFKRQHHSAKFLIPLTRLPAPLAQGTAGSALLIFGQRWPAHYPQIHRLGPLASLRGLVEHMVIGVGLPMVVEYFVRHRLTDWLKLARIAFHRARLALALWQQGSSWQLNLGNDRRANAQALLALVERL